MSHRSNHNVSMLSNYSLGDKAIEKETEEVGEWIDTVEFEHGSIREMFVKKRPKRKTQVDEAAADEEMVVESIFTTYNIIIMVGTHRIE